MLQDSRYCSKVIVLVCVDQKAQSDTSENQLFIHPKLKPHLGFRLIVLTPLDSLADDSY